MIVVDIETSGLDTGRCGIWQIGALEFENPENTFLEEARIDDEDDIEEEALTLTGKTEKELRDESKQSQKQMILNFLNWLKNFKERVIAGHNIGWDSSFIQNKCFRYGIRDEFRKIMGQRAIDSHTLAQIKYKEEHGEFKIFPDTKKSAMNLSSVLEFVGLKDERTIIESGKIVQEGTPHNALEDCKLEAECFSRLIYGKSLLPEFAKFKIPEYLK